MAEMRFFFPMTDYEAILNAAWAELLRRRGLSDDVPLSDYCDVDVDALSEQAKARALGRWLASQPSPEAAAAHPGLPATLRARLVRQGLDMAA